MCNFNFATSIDLSLARTTTTCEAKDPKLGAIKTVTPCSVDVDLNLINQSQHATNREQRGAIGWLELVDEEVPLLVLLCTTTSSVLTHGERGWWGRTTTWTSLISFGSLGCDAVLSTLGDRGDTLLTSIFGRPIYRGRAALRTLFF